MEKMNNLKQFATNGRYMPKTELYVQSWKTYKSIKDDYNAQKVSKKEAVTMEEMENWNHFRAWEFLIQNSIYEDIPEKELYVRSLESCKTIDIRNDELAQKKILESLKPRTLILIDGASLNGKTTFAERLAHQIGAKILDVDIVLLEWIDEQQKKMNDNTRMFFSLVVDMIANMWLMENLENIIKNECHNSVILVGSCLEAIYRAIIVKTLGKYFNQVVSIYCCSKNRSDVEMMMKKREAEFGVVLSPEIKDRAFHEYQYSQRLLESDDLMLGAGMAASFIADISVSDMFL